MTDTASAAEPALPRVLCLRVGPSDHGVVLHGAIVAEELARVTPVTGVAVHARHLDSVESLAGAVNDAGVGDSWVGDSGVGSAEVHGTGVGSDPVTAVHVEVTDALFGNTPAEAVAALADALPERATLWLHDVPQPAEGEARCARRAPPADPAPLPPELAGIDQDVVVLGHVYPGKGHEEALDALIALHAETRSGGSERGPIAPLPRRVTALRPVASGHEDIVASLQARSRAWPRVPRHRVRARRRPGHRPAPRRHPVRRPPQCVHPDPRAVSRLLLAW